MSYAIYLILLRWIPYAFAYGVAYAAGIVWSYFSNTIFVFRHRPSIRRAALFPLVYVAQYLLGTALMFLLVEALHVPEKLAPLGVIALTIPLTYLLSRRIITGRSRVA